MTDDPTPAAWAVADDLWKLMQDIAPAKAKTIFTTIVASNPQTLQQARNVLKDAALLKG